MPNDNWHHRHDNIRCQTCLWYAEKQADSRIAIEMGRCHRHAPTMTGFPPVFPSDWCGDHKVDETKLLKYWQPAPDAAPPENQP